MRVLINAGNGGLPMGDDTCQLIKSWGFDAARTGLFMYAPEENLAAIIEELARNQLQGLFIVGGWNYWGQDGEIVEKIEAHPHEDVAEQCGVVARLMLEKGCSGWIECSNEPDITKYLNPQRFVDQCHASLEAVRQEGDIPFITGGVANLAKRGGLRYLRECLRKGLPTSREFEGVSVGIHPYRTGLKPWNKFEGQTITELYNLVYQEAGDFSVTELGWHTAPQTRKSGLFGLCRKKFSWTNEDIKKFAEWELKKAKEAGAVLYCWYNINDGPNPNLDMDRYGIRRFDTFDDAKPVVKTFIDWGLV